MATLVAGTGPAGAKPRREPPTPAHDPNRSDLWRDAIEPHADEIAQILRRVRDDFSNVEATFGSDIDPTGSRRLVSLRDAYGALRYARRLSPQNLDVLAQLGRAADALGNTKQAIEAYQMYLSLAEPAKTSADDVAGALGMIYLRLGRLDDAIRYLERDDRADSGRSSSAEHAVALATALAARGQMNDAIDSLVAATGPPSSYPSGSVALEMFALAVMYDRDEQPSAAFETLDHLQTTLQTGFASELHTAISQAAFPIPEDLHYYLALLYEISGLYTESRTEWAMYAAIPDAPYRGRALDHIANLDVQRRTAKPAPGAAASVPSVYPPPPTIPPPPRRVRHRSHP